MSMFRSAIPALAILALTSCSKKPPAGDDKAGATPAADDKAASVKSPDKPAAPAGRPATVGAWQDVPNLAGLVADVPSGVVPNGVGGAGGFHKEGGALEITIMETSPEETAKDFAQMKKYTEEVVFKTWVKAEQTANGWVLEWTGPKLNGEGNEVPGAVVYSYQVRRKLDGKTYTCYGVVDAAAEYATVEASCASLRAR